MRDYAELHFSGNAKLSYNVQGEEDEKSYYFEKIIKVRNMIRTWNPKIGKNRSSEKYYQNSNSFYLIVLKTSSPN